jgi:acyl-CoA synthetase (AMP-forming)/AMP-acid ligase II/acyl carrier protein
LFAQNFYRVYAGERQPEPMSSYQGQRAVVSQRAFVDVVRQRAANEPSRTAFIFVGEEERSRQLLTYQELDRRAKKIAVWLEKQGLRGERVLIAQPHNLDYIAALLGCFYAGSIAVPVYPPKLNKHFERLSGIISDARPAIALANGAVLAKVRATSNRAPALQELRWYDVEEMDENHNDWTQPEIAKGQTALLQYTSGSTGSPKGIVVSYENLAVNESMIQEAFKVTESSVIVGWLPLYHDMGLIGNVLQPLWTGAPCVLMSPAAFLQRPVRWLQLISENRGTISGAPNFAYDLCCRKVTAEERAHLDLSSWQIAFNGSEPVRVETLERFTQIFGASGFQRSAWFPCYGLAEATLFVAGGNEGGFPRVESSRVGEPQAHRAYNGDGIRKESTVVSCGRGGAAEKIVIVDPETLAPCRPYQVGEVWVAGKNVAQGYWNQPQSTRETFQAFLKDKKGPFLRTSDLGFLSEDQYLFITGRSKDLIIIRGCNHYPQDLEYTLQNSHSVFSGGSAAAFCLEVNGEIELAILQEVVTRDKGLDFGGLIETAVRAVAEEHGLRAYVALVKGGTLPRTTSGKIRRSECKRQFLENSLVLLGDSRAPFSLTTDLAEQNGPSPDRTQNSHERQDVAETLRNMVAHVIGLPRPLVAIDKPLTALGLDSLQAGELKAAISDQWQIDLPWEMLLEGPPIAELAVYVLAGLDSEQRSQAVHIPTEADSVYSLSFGQRALWFLYKLAPANAVYNVPRFEFEMRLTAASCGRPSRCWLTTIPACVQCSKLVKTGRCRGSSRMWTCRSRSSQRKHGLQKNYVSA